MNKRLGAARLLLPAAGAVSGAALAGRAWRRFLRRSVPASYGQIAVSGLIASVEVRRDRWGVPHLYAANEHDLFFAQGYSHAQDRLFQMDTLRRVGAGRVSELVGPSALATDRLARCFGWPRVARAVVDGADGYVVDVMAAYAAGVNAFIANGNLPPEFALLHYEPEPWGLADTAAWSAVLAWGLAGNWETELLRLSLLEALGPDKTADLAPHAAADYVSILGQEGIDAHFALALAESLREAVANLALGAVPRGRGVGSNNWAVSGALTSSGRPVLANDPHLPPIFPALWYENHLVGGDYEVTGFTMPGVPGVIIGHNRQVAWGLTNAFPDVQDVLIERFDPHDPTRYEVNGRWESVELVEEVIRVRGQTDHTEIVRYTRHGPVFSDYLPQGGRDMALQWASYTPSNHLRALLDMNRARDWASFAEALRPWGFPSQNVVFADTHGDIAYKMPGMVPRRRTGDGLLPAPGWDDAFEWEDWIPFEELPTRVNPPSGFIVTANNRVHGREYPYLLTGEWLPDYRARRIEELLLAQVPIPFARHAQIQADTVSLQARRFLPAALKSLDLPQGIVEPELVEALALLRAWDGDMRADLVAPSLYFGWFTHFAEATTRQALGGALAGQLLTAAPADTYMLDSFLELLPDLALQWLEDGAPSWIGDVRPLLLPALRRTLLVLEQQFGADQTAWQWGNLHRIEAQHPLTRIPVAGRPWQIAPIPVGGDGYTVNQADVLPKFPPEPVKVIASCRLIMDVGAWDNSLAALPGGQAGQPGSPHYQDALQEWRNGRYHPLLFSRERVLAATESITLLRPLPQAQQP
jgi:penicillin amidase